MIPRVLGSLPLIRQARRVVHRLDPRAQRGRERGVRPDVALPFDMFDLIRTADEAKIASKLEGIYHRGQDRVWDGKKVLAELVERHGQPRLPPEKAEAVRQLFAVILWGELAAWKISADLATQIEPLEAKMAATSQTHDEARHFYVMHDYLALLGDVPKRLGPATERVLTGVIQADNLAKKLLGMQLMIEPMALTLFQTMREHKIEPVLCDLLKYYERDEARHVALGVLHLPKLLSGMSLPEALNLWGWEFRELWSQLPMLREMEPHFRTLGIDPLKVLELGRNKQVRANTMMMEELGYDLNVQHLFLRFFDAKSRWDFPDGSRADLPARVRGALDAALRGTAGSEDALREPAPA